MTIFIGAAPVDAGAVKQAEPKAETDGKKKSGRPTKADLLAECAELGIEASPDMTNPELAALIDAAKGE